jgi:hypothetical protein
MPGRSALGFLRRSPFSTSTCPSRNPLSGFGSPSEFHQRAPRGLLSAANLNVGCRFGSPFSSRGFFPSSVLPVVGSHITPVSSHLTGYVAPSGFLTLSTPCSPHDLPGLFHPGSAHGVSPFGALFLLPVPYALSSAASLLELTSTLPVGALLQGFAHRQESRPKPWGLATRLLRMPPWAFSPPRFLALRSDSLPFQATCHPLTRFVGLAAC